MGFGIWDVQRALSRARPHICQTAPRSQLKEPQIFGINPQNPMELSPRHPQAPLQGLGESSSPWSVRRSCFKLRERFWLIQISQGRRLINGLVDFQARRSFYPTRFNSMTWICGGLCLALALLGSAGGTGKG